LCAAELCEYVSNESGLTPQKGNKMTTTEIVETATLAEAIAQYDEAKAARDRGEASWFVLDKAVSMMGIHIESQKRAAA